YNADGLLAWNEAAQKDKSINCTLSADINMAGKEWTPIGTDENNSYNGIFDGNGNTITGLTVNQSEKNYAGLFGCIGSGGTVKDVTLTKARVTGGSNVGGVAGQNEGTVENCSVDGTVTGTEYNTGGIVGINYGTISGCKTEGTVTGNANVGGIAGNGAANYDTGTGNLIGSTIEGCHSTAAVSGSSTVGGVVGNLGNGCSLMACYSTGDVTATLTTGYAGGVMGANSRGTVTGCYHATGTVSGQGNVGGIVGFNSSGTFTACYWSGSPGKDNGRTTEVTEGNWSEAMTAMNSALQSAGSEWRYELTGELPTLKKEE
ncbi:GLUG motif-containing protein, partial [Alistipes sp.]|uniref:GLUG motif-containing protein n=1 Tax=Alistipes sp. TaxID=1872444 RepID=UPI0025C33898